MSITKYNENIIYLPLPLANVTSTYFVDFDRAFVYAEGCRRRMCTHGAGKAVTRLKRWNLNADAAADTSVIHYPPAMGQRNHQGPMSASVQPTGKPLAVKAHRTLCTRIG